MREILSIRQFTRRNLIVLMGILCLLMSALFFGLRAYLLEENRLAQHRRIEQQADSLSYAIDLYRSIVAKLASQPAVADFLALSMEDEAYRWARQMRTLLPGSMGLGLFDEDGRLLGNPMQLRLGEMCVLDMEHYISGDILPGPRVHRGMRGKEHFDVVATVHSLDDTPGVVFASFGLATMQQALERITLPGQALELAAYDGSPIARTDRLTSRDNLLEYEVAVPDTDWVLRARMEIPPLGPVAAYLAGTFSALVTILALFLFLSSRTISNLFVREMESIHQLIRGLHEGEAVSGPTPRLQETRQIFNGILQLTRNIASYQEHLRRQSTTDELTGLLNRRALKEAYAGLVDSVKSGKSACLAIIDVDHFKPVNDLHGHAMGDQVLKCLAEALGSSTYDDDVCIRLGGDEFLVMLREFEPSSLQHWFETLSRNFRSNLASAGIAEADQCTLSGGAVALTPELEDPGLALRLADQALYQAKQAGRNRIALHSPAGNSEQDHSSQE